jgi:hypothetical protein
MTKNLFYAMQFEFQKMLHYLRDTWSPFYNLPEHINSNTSVIRTFTNLDKGSIPIGPN